MNRDNQAWIEDLSTTGADRDSALIELREVLFRNLRKALSKDDRLDDSFLEDVVQDALLRILDRLDQFKGGSRFPTWATAIAIHLAMTELRRRRWRDVSLNEVLKNSDLHPGHVAHSSGPEQQSERIAIIQTMHELIQATLTEKQRIALLAELKGMPQVEIARHLESNRNAIYKLTHDARKKLKHGLESAGYGAEDISSIFAS